MKKIPTDRNVLLHYHVRHYRRARPSDLEHLPQHAARRVLLSGAEGWYRDGTKWEECRYHETLTGFNCWRPSSGNPRVINSLRIREEDIIDWRELPD